MVQSPDGRREQEMAGVSTSEYLALNRQISYAAHANDVPVTVDHTVGKNHKDVDETILK